ncbi:MAG: hypothetical protein ABIJ20_02935 [Nanoarchaeota archaeon]|nr:hypothetical protein [Nanoarchaeota archaeon]MBU1445491.1 hypothetical protein [Nanoarchaeota archaeon]MBU2406583.1 hypothetical protein [Nanoarchaeota archaeon]MBU2420697.1 hypothetical protein [Nanoarchaeota archaeon]MBU2475662.1 hypothetical protein [Nanoarchaeota archaeon]
MQLDDKLNITVYKTFPERGAAPIRSQLPLLLAEGRTLMSGKTLMERRLGASDESRKNWENNYFHIALLNVRDPTTEEVRAVLANEHPDLLAKITPEADLTRDYGLPVKPEEYADMEGFTFNSGEVSRLQGDVYSLPSKRQAFWEFVAEGDTKLLQDYREMVSKVTGKAEDKVMGVYPSSRQGARLWCADGLGGRSSARGYSLGDGSGRLVGVAPEAQVAISDGQLVAPNLSRILATSKPFVAEASREDFERSVSGLYKKGGE